MAASDDNRTSGVLKFQELMLDEMRTSHKALGNKVDSYRDENVALHQKLDGHILECNLRYRMAQKKMQDLTPIANPSLVASIHPDSALFSNKRLVKRLWDEWAPKLILVVLVIVFQAIVFLWEHGFRPSVPDFNPAAPAAHAPP